MMAREEGDEAALGTETELDPATPALDSDHTTDEARQGQQAIGTGRAVIALDQAGGALQGDEAMDEEAAAGGEGEGDDIARRRGARAKGGEGEQVAIEDEG
jgi:hypothetical protein